jgi:hypothetical protein
VRLSKKEQIAQRRAEVLKLSSQGLSQQAIADRLEKFHISQQTVSRDLEWLERNSIEYVKKNREQMAFEYQKVMTNFFELRKEAWAHFNAVKGDNSNPIKTSLYNILASINNDIMNYLSIGYMIDAELIKHAKQDADDISEKMNKLTNDIKLNSQAKF